MPQPYTKKAPTLQGHIEDLVQKSRTLQHTGYDALQACHRIAHLRTACALDDERIAMLKEREITRREKLARLKRDYKIIMFQAREAELECQMEDLQAEFNHQVVQAKCLLKAQDEQYQKTMFDLQAKHATLSSELKQKSAEVVVAHKQREDVENELQRLREARADQAAATTVTNASEVNVKEAKAEVDRLEKVVEKEKGRVAKLKDVLREWKAEAEEQQTYRKQAEDEATDARNVAEKFEQEISELKAQLTAALKPSAAPKSKKHSPRIHLTSENEAGDSQLPTSVTDQTRPKARPIKYLEAADSDIEIVKPSAKARGKRKVFQEESADDEKPSPEKPKRTRAKKANVVAPKKTTKKRAPDSEAKSKKTAAESSVVKTSKSAATGDSAAEDGQEPAPKKKKRKLNVGIFPSTQQQPLQFRWDQDGVGLGIPTELSPVKDAHTVPRRLHPSSSGPSFSKIRG